MRLMLACMMGAAYARDSKTIERHKAVEQEHIEQEEQVGDGQFLGDVKQAFGNKQVDALGE